MGIRTTIISACVLLAACEPEETAKIIDPCAESQAATVSAALVDPCTSTPNVINYSNSGGFQFAVGDIFDPLEDSSGNPITASAEPQDAWATVSIFGSMGYAELDFFGTAEALAEATDYTKTITTPVIFGRMDVARCLSEDIIYFPLQVTAPVAATNSTIYFAGTVEIVRDGPDCDILNTLATTDLIEPLSLGFRYAVTASTDSIDFSFALVIGYFPFDVAQIIFNSFGTLSADAAATVPTSMTCISHYSVNDDLFGDTVCEIDEN